MTPRERLALLSERNRSRNPNTHDMGEWSCFTTCCVAGFAASEVPEFQAEGFKLVTRAPVFGFSVGWTAVRDYFNLPPSQSNWIFNEECYSTKPTPHQVSDRIDQLLQETER